MAKNHSVQIIPRSRIATFDVFAAGKKKHHVAALLEFDVTESRLKIRQLKRDGSKISFNGWLTAVIGHTLSDHPMVASFRQNKRRQLIFNSIDVSMIAEKSTGSHKVPIPFLIQNADKKNAVEISAEIRNAVNAEISDKDIVIHKKQKKYERLYHILPGTIRRWFWKILLNRPVLAFRTMGNVSVTSLSMAGQINAWFIHSSVHPVSFGIGSVIKKPVVVNDSVQIREMLNITVLLDHDVVDGMPMAKFVKALGRNIENGFGL